MDGFEASLGLIWLAGTNFLNGGLVSAKLAKFASAGQVSDFIRLADLATLAGPSALERRNDWGSNFLKALILLSLRSDDLPYFPPFGAGDHTAPAYFS
jgi:hypothetical protein